MIIIVREYLPSSTLSPVQTLSITLELIQPPPPLLPVDSQHLPDKMSETENFCQMSSGTLNLRKCLLGDL